MRVAVRARLLPRVSTSVGDRKALHNDGNGTALTAHVVAEAGDRESEMCVLSGRMSITVANVVLFSTCIFPRLLPLCIKSKAVLAVVNFGGRR